MGAMISIVFDKSVISTDQVTSLSLGLQTVVSEVIDDSDVFIYSQSPSSILGADPIEVFIQLNAHKTADPEAVTESIAKAVKSWKTTSHFQPPINLNVIPVPWYSEFQI